MKRLFPGDTLLITRVVAGLGVDPEEVLDVYQLKPGDLVHYIKPLRLLVELKDGTQLDLPTDSLEITEEKIPNHIIFNNMLFLS